MNPFIDRLEVEHLNLLTYSKDNKKFSFLVTKFLQKMPVRYRFKFNNIKTIEKIENDIPIYRENFSFEIDLTQCFSAPPLIFTNDIIYHPNILTPRVCIGTSWRASRSISEIAKMLFDMITWVPSVITYKRNVSPYPLDSKAAAWAEKMITSKRLRIPLL